MITFVRNGRLYTFANETSHFRREEHDALNIDITETDNFDDVLNHGLAESVAYNADSMSSTLRDILTANIDRQAILTFNPSNYTYLSKDVVLFYNKLRMVLWNNSQDMQVSRFESYLHEFAAHLFYCAELEDGYNLTMVPCNLELVIEQQRFAAYADREGRRGTKTIWILDEDKHRFDTRYKDGIIQLVGCLIAAAQRNKANLLSNRPAKLIGTLIKGDRIHICSAVVTDEYLEALTSGIPNNSTRLNVMKYPDCNGLSFANNTDLGTIFNNLAGIRQYGLSVQPSYEDL